MLISMLLITAAVVLAGALIVYVMAGYTGYTRAEKDPEGDWEWPNRPGGVIEELHRHKAEGSK